MGHQMFELGFHSYALQALSAPGISHRTHGINMVFNMRWSNHEDLVNAMEFVSCSVETWATLKELFPSYKPSIEAHEKGMKDPREQDSVVKEKRNYTVAYLGRVRWETDEGKIKEEVAFRQVRWPEWDSQVRGRCPPPYPELGLEEGAKLFLEQTRKMVNSVGSPPFVDLLRRTKAQG